MRFYPGAHEYLHEASKKSDVFDQHLYLVPEVKNEHDIHAVMLHNGKQKLGSVTSSQSPEIRRLFADWKRQNGAGPKDDEVIVCYLDRILIDPNTFTFQGKLVVYGKHRVNERLARKYAGKMLNLKD